MNTTKQNYARIISVIILVATPFFSYADMVPDNTGSFVPDSPGSFITDSGSGSFSPDLYGAYLPDSIGSFVNDPTISGSFAPDSSGTFAPDPTMPGSFVLDSPGVFSDDIANGNQSPLGEVPGNGSQSYIGDGSACSFFCNVSSPIACCSVTPGYGDNFSGGGMQNNGYNSGTSYSGSPYDGYNSFGNASGGGSGYTNYQSYSSYGSYGGYSGGSSAGYGYTATPSGAFQVIPITAPAAYALGQTGSAYGYASSGSGPGMMQVPGFNYGNSVNSGSGPGMINIPGFDYGNSASTNSDNSGITSLTMVRGSYGQSPMELDTTCSIKFVAQPYGSQYYGQIMLIWQSSPDVQQAVIYPSAGQQQFGQVAPNGIQWVNPAVGQYYKMTVSGRNGQVTCDTGPDTIAIPRVFSSWGYSSVQ